MALVPRGEKLLVVRDDRTSDTGETFETTEESIRASHGYSARQRLRKERGVDVRYRGAFFSPSSRPSPSDDPRVENYDGRTPRK